MMGGREGLVPRSRESEATDYVRDQLGFRG